jgi:hypothetical protein
MVERAGQDNNHLQKAVNVHESAFTWGVVPTFSGSGPGNSDYCSQ